MGKGKVIAGNAARLLFALFATASGLLWFPILNLIRGNIDGLDVSFQDRTILTTLLVFGLVFGLLYHEVVVFLKRPPSALFALFIPGVVVNVHLLVTRAMGKDLLFGSPLESLIVYNVGVYIGLGWFIVPLGIPYILLLGRVYRVIEAWSLRAPRRSIRYVAWAFAACALVITTDGVRYYRGLLAKERAAILANLDATLPSDAELFRRGPSLAFDSPGTDSVWFRRKGGLPWPPSSPSAPLSNPDSMATITERARLAANIEIDANPKIHQLKWSQDHRTIQATLIRTPTCDYIEFIRW